MSDFWEVSPVFVIFPTFAVMLKWYLEYLTRKRIVEKGQLDENIKYLYFNTLEQYAPSSLKWGLVFFLVGAALIVIKTLPGYVSDETVLGVILIAAGTGLLLYYLIANAMRAKSRNKLENHTG